MTPASIAKRVLETYHVSGIPAQCLTEIASSENIAYRHGDYPDDTWNGMLLSKGGRKAILINTHKSNLGKQNFTFAHELGHYFLNHTASYSADGRNGFRCVAVGSEQERGSIEAEANRFAVELLMPEDRFRLDMAGTPIDFDLINSLSKKYQVSKHAISNRILDFVQTPYIIVTTQGLDIKSLKCSQAAKSHMRSFTQIPSDTIAYDVITKNQQQLEFAETDSSKWLNRSLVAGQLYECTRGNAISGYFMIILRW